MIDFVTTRLLDRQSHEVSRPEVSKSNNKSLNL